MKAIILAGGKGTRLSPFTTIIPKPLVPLGNKPILDIIVKQLYYFGFKDITLTLGYLSEIIQAYFTGAKETISNINIRYIKELEPLGTAGSLGLLEKQNIKDSFLVMNGDILTSLNFNKLIEFHKKKDGILTIATHIKKIKIDLGVIEYDENHVLTGYIEKPEKEYPVSMGIYIYKPEVLNYIERDEYLDFPNLVLRLIGHNEKVVSYPCDSFWMDIGRQEDYVLAQEKFEQMKNIFLPGSNY